jgi:hypothetical protein
MARFRNTNRRLPRIASAAFLAVLAVAVAVPCPALGCCASAAKESCCCQKHDDTAAGTSCCQKSGTAESNRTADTHDQCSAGACPCCQQAPPQNIPTDRNADRTPVDHGFTAPVATWSSATNFSVAQTLDTPVEILTAIPHRILHCSWLI